jgi:hypothetical protein
VRLINLGHQGLNDQGAIPLDIPEPIYQVGQPVRVILGERNRTPHSGTVREIVWHSKDQCHHYYIIKESGKKVSKRYTAEDLESV